MRDILFRGKLMPAKKKWIYGNMVMLDEDHVFICPRCEEASTLSCHEIIKLSSEMVAPETICQYTGVNAKDRAPIFEGDILRMDSFTPNVCEVKFIEGAFCLVFPDPGPAWPVDIHYVHHADKPQATVIGNVYDNPELLGVKL